MDAFQLEKSSLSVGHASAKRRLAMDPVQLSNTVSDRRCHCHHILQTKRRLEVIRSRERLFLSLHSAAERDASTWQYALPMLPSSPLEQPPSLPQIAPLRGMLTPPQPRVSSSSCTPRSRHWCRHDDINRSPSTSYNPRGRHWCRKDGRSYASRRHN